MTDLAGMPSYFWLVSPGLKTPVRDDIPYTTQALRQDLLRVRTAWDDCQANRDRDAIYTYLSAVFDLVMWWAAEGRAISRARWALRLQGAELTSHRRTVCCHHLVHRRSKESGQANAIQVVARAAVRSGVQDERRTAGRVRSAKGWHQQMCGAIYPISRAARDKLSVRPSHLAAANARIRPTAAGRSPDWLKMKNPCCDAVKREAEEDWGR